MSLYSLISSILSYVFTTIIYLFIFSIIVLIYRDIKKVSKNTEEDIDEIDAIDEAESVDEEEYDVYEYDEDSTAILRTVVTKESKRYSLRKKYRIGVGPIVIGRNPECDIAIPDVYLSQEHFKIGCNNNGWYITDLNSKNGTFLNDIPINGTSMLEDDDVISFGDIEFVFNIEN